MEKTHIILELMTCHFHTCLPKHQTTCHKHILCPQLEDNGKLGVGLSAMRKEQEDSFIKVSNKKSVLNCTKEHVERVSDALLPTE
jgi:hypothetical protein